MRITREKSQIVRLVVQAPAVVPPRKEFTDLLLFDCTANRERKKYMLGQTPEPLGVFCTEASLDLMEKR